MCNFILLSCDSGIDLTNFENEWLCFKALKDNDLALNPEVKYLSYANNWLITSQTSPGCGCGFRHVMHINHGMGFGEPEDWYEEDTEDILATKAFYRVVRTLVNQGCQVDSFDLFDNNEGITTLLNRLDIDTQHISADAFRFFEQVVFDYQ
jgi:hypothetical protein